MTFRSVIRRHPALFIILAVASVARLLPLFRYEFTYDELSGIERTAFGGFSELFEKGIRVDAHPALVQVLLFILVKCFGPVEWILKLPFILVSLGGIVYAYRTGLRFFSKQSAVFAAAVCAVSLPFVYHAPVARMYAPGIFFSFGMLCHFHAICFRDDAPTREYALFGLFALLSALNHHINALFAFTVTLAALLLSVRTRLKPLLITCAVVLMLYAPHIPVTIAQFGLAGIGPEQGGWLDKPSPFVLVEFVNVLFGTGPNALIVFLICILFAFMERVSNFARPRLVLLALFIVNYAVIHLYSLFRAPVYQHSVMLFAGTSLLIFVASYFTTTREKFFLVALNLVCILMVFRTYAVKKYYRKCIHTGFDQQFARTAKLKAEGSDVYPLLFGADRNMKRVYFSKYNVRFDCKTVEDSMMSLSNGALPDGKSPLRRFDEFVAGLRSDHVVLSSAVPIHQRVVMKHFPLRTAYFETPTELYEVYAKIETPSQSRETPGFTPTAAGPLKFRVDAETSGEFPCEAKGEMKDLVQREGQVIFVAARVKPEPAVLKDLELCISLNDGDKPLAYSARNAADFLPNSDSTVTLMTELFVGSTLIREKGGKVACYLWNRGKKPFRLVDFKIEVIDYWQTKWHFWN